MAYNPCICIPARYNSSRLPGKLMLDLGGKTCIQHTIDNVIPLGLMIYVFCDHDILYEHLNEKYNKRKVKIIKAYKNYKNGTERISRNIHKVPTMYNIIVNVQADEPFINPINVQHAIQRYKETMTESTLQDNKICYVTLHEEFIPDTNQKELYLKGTASLTVTTSLTGKVLTYTRNIIPWNKEGLIKKYQTYNLFTGIYVFNRVLLTKISNLPDTPLQLKEDIEQLKILEHGYDIYSFPSKVFNEISLNDTNDLEYLCNKYNITNNSNNSNNSNEQHDPQNSQEMYIDENTDRWEIHVWTDGACENNQNEGKRRAGVGVWFGYNDERNLSEPLEGDVQTNNRAELTAIIRAIELFGKTAEPGQCLIIHTDSMYCINGIRKWMEGWKKRKWMNSKKQPVKNKDLWLIINNLIKTYKIEMRWVAGHSGDDGNTHADRLAVEGIDRAR